MSEMKLTENRLNIMRCISLNIQGIRPISRKLEISHIATRKNLMALESAGYLRLVKRSSICIYGLTSLGKYTVDALNKGLVTAPGSNSRIGRNKVTISDEFREIQRLHNTRFKIPHKNPIPVDIPDSVMFLKDYPIKKRKLNNWNQYEVDFGNFIVLINTKSTEIRGIQVEADLYTETSELVFRAVQIFEPFLEDIEMLISKRIPSFKFLRDARGAITLMFDNKEIAQEGDAFAQKALKKGNRWVVYDQEDGKPRWTVDRSPEKLPGRIKGTREIEALHHKKALEDNEKLRSLKVEIGRKKWEDISSNIDTMTMGEFLNDLGDGKWDYRKEHELTFSAIKIILELAKRDATIQDRLDQLVSLIERLVEK